MRQKFFADADARILDGKFERRLAAEAGGFFDLEIDRAALGRELDGVAQNIYQHLPEFDAVADIIFVDVPADAAIVIQIFFLALTAENRIDLFDQF